MNVFNFKKMKIIQIATSAEFLPFVFILVLLIIFKILGISLNGAEMIVGHSNRYWGGG